MRPLWPCGFGCPRSKTATTLPSEHLAYRFLNVLMPLPIMKNFVLKFGFLCLSLCYLGWGGVALGTQPLVVPLEEEGAACESLLSSASEGAAQGKLLSASEFVRQFLDTKEPLESARMLLARYPELAWLTGAVDATPELQPAGGATPSASLSEQLFGQKHIELDRSLVGILLLKWVLTRNYKAFVTPQNAAVRLTRKNFEHLARYTKKILLSPERIDAMIAYMAINDLGKVRSVVSEVQKRSGLVDVDHDSILLKALETMPEIAPSFQRLSGANRHIMMRGLGAKFNVGQFLQAENVPASLTGLKPLDKEELDFYLLHALVDIGGAAGHVTHKGSIVMTNPTYEGFKMALAALAGLVKGKTEAEVYDNFLAAKGESLDLWANNPKYKAIVRLLCMLRVSDQDTVKNTAKIFESLPENAQAILIKELNISGLEEDEQAVLPYYAPAFLANLINFFKSRNQRDYFQKGLTIGLMTLAEVYQQARILLTQQEGGGVFTVMLSALAEAAKAPAGLVSGRYQLEAVGANGVKVLILPQRSLVRSAQFGRLESLGSLPGKKVALVGMGGGSDVVQAAQLGLLLKDAGKDTPFVISVRTDKTSSQGASLVTGEERSISPHGGEVVKGVYKVLAESKGSGRFVENLPASKIPTYLVIDKQDGRLLKQIQAVINLEGGVDTIVGIDTGGDVLYSPQGSQGLHKAKATPDQDQRVLEALSKIQNAHLLLGVIATGVDAPLDAQEVLERAGAKYYALGEGEANKVRRQYMRWEMDGRSGEKFSKTALVWQMALEGRRGLQVLNLPEAVVTDSANPWNPFMRIEDAMAGIMFMPIKALVQNSGIKRSRREPAP